MGVPRFFKWIAERYPCIISPFNDATIPTIDNLYLDMNGIIHTCARSDEKTLSRPTEKELMLRIFQYIDKLFNVIKPRKHFFMAIDGVAPRAKMNQQRSRRFRSAFEAHQAREELKKKGEPVPDDTFDSNAITPGTEFMSLLSEHLQYLVRKKVQEDMNWQQCKVIFSGHEVPGEGEHKIMWFIRNRKMTEKNYNPNETHCLYGLDADLIMLGLATHEPHFMLLREEVFAQFVRRPNKTNIGDNDPINQKFQLLHIGVLREYLDLEFRDALVKNGTQRFQYDLERVIDDFIAICFLCGNDFIPNMATLDIREGAISKLFDIYKEVVPALGDYLTKNGTINFDQMEAFIAHIAKEEQELLQSRLTTLLSKKRVKSVVRKHKRKKRLAKVIEKEDTFKGEMILEENELDVEIEPNEDAIGDDDNDDDGLLRSEIAENELLFSEEEDDDEADDDDKLELLVRALKKDGTGLDFEQWYRLYYLKKFDIDITRDPMAGSKKAQVVVSYVEGLKWIYEYYYNGCVSWKWFYPYHYAPICSDLTNLKAIADGIQFELDRPFHPYEQLLGVLPPKSSKLLPHAYRKLLLSHESPILDFYPETFEIDREGTRYDYEGTVLLPFIDEDRLRSAIQTIDQSSLTEKERKRNTFSVELLFEHVPPSSTSTAFEPYMFKSTLPGDMPDIIDCNVKVTEFKASDFKPPKMRFLPRLCHGVHLGSRAPEGFPSLFSKDIHDAKLDLVGLTLFGYPSRMPSMCIQTEESNDDETEEEREITVEDVSHLLDQRIYIGYPFPRLAQVASLSDKETNVYKEKGGMKRERHLDEDSFVREARHHQNTLKQRYALDIGKVEVLLFVRLFNGMKKNKKGAIVRSFTDEEFAFPYQLIAEKYNPIPDPKFRPKRAIPIEVEYPIGTKVIPVSNEVSPDFIGEKCIVLGYDRERTKIRVSIDPKQRSTGADEADDPWQLPPLHDIPALVPPEVAAFANQKYYPFHVAGKKIGMSARDIGLVIGRWNIVDHRGNSVNIGLNLRDTRYDKRVIGYVKHDTSNQTLDETYYLNFNRQTSSSPSQFSVEGQYRWELSDKAVDLLRDYKKNFPELFESIAHIKSPSDTVDLLSIYGNPEDSEAKFKELRTWLDEQEYRKLPFLPSNSLLLPDDLIVALEQNFINYVQNRDTHAAQQQQKGRPNSITIDPTAVYKPSNPLPKHLPFFARDAYDIGHHVVYLSGAGQVPFGLSGIIVGVEGTNANVVFPVEFVGGHTLNNKLQTFRGQSVPLESLLNLTAAQRRPRKSSSPKRQSSVARQNLRENYASHYYTVERYSTARVLPGPSERNAQTAPPPVIPDYASGYRGQKSRVLKKERSQRGIVSVENMFSELGLGQRTEPASPSMTAHIAVPCDPSRDFHSQNASSTPQQRRGTQQTTTPYLTEAQILAMMQNSHK